MKSFNLKVYEIVKKVPRGKVITYGEVAYLVQNNVYTRSEVAKVKINPRFLPRLVGFVLHKNKDPKVPCHRVVDRNGRLAPNFAFDGWCEQQRRLVAEGVSFLDEMHVDLKKCLW